MRAPLGVSTNQAAFFDQKPSLPLGDYGCFRLHLSRRTASRSARPSALQTGKPFLRVQHGRGFACAANGKGCILRNGEGGRIVKIQIEIAVIRSACGILDTDFSGNGDGIRILGRCNGTEPSHPQVFRHTNHPKRDFFL